MDLHHPITREFPEYRDTVKKLRGDAAFRGMFDEYHTLDDAICRIEEDIDFATDQEIEELKWRRARLKDQIYRAIRHAGTVQLSALTQQPAGPATSLASSVAE